jgi:DNA-binding Xre family transcriptional regulator
MVRLKVKEIAVAKGFSQRQISIRTGIDINAVRRIFRYPIGTNVKVDTLDKIARVLEVDVSELIESVPDDFSALDG